MPKYRYQAVDAQGNPASGELEAAGPEEARRQLAAQGLQADRATLEEVAEPVSAGGRLTDEEAVELGSQLAELAKAGLPLGPGLRAMAAEMPRYRTALALREIAGQLDAGMSLEAALESQGKRFPAHVRGLVLAGMASGRLVDALEELVALENARIELRRTVWLTLAYPCILMAAVVALFLLCCLVLAPQFALIFEEFGLQVPFATQLLVWLAGAGVYLVVGVAALLVAACVVLIAARSAAWAQSVVYAVPLVGPVWRWLGLWNFSRLMALLLGEQVPLPEALRLTAAGLREGGLSAACRGAAREVEEGRSLAESFSGYGQFPPSLRPLVDWGERTSDPAAAFQAATEMFEGRVQLRVQLLNTVLPPIVFVLIIATVAFLVRGTLVPMILLIRNLTGF
jgi:general secretion pathway protein F